MKRLSTYPNRHEFRIVIITVFVLSALIGSIIIGEFSVLGLLIVALVYLFFMIHYNTSDVWFDYEQKQFCIRKQFQKPVYYHVNEFVKIKHIIKEFYIIYFNDNIQFIFMLNIQMYLKDYFSLDVDFRRDVALTKEFRAIAKQYEEEQMQ
ncbi:MAG: hypothetical protein ACK5C0_08500 [Candidatus Kapaibacterium sp.]|jgi:hypothetical protein